MILSCDTLFPEICQNYKVMFGIKTCLLSSLDVMKFVFYQISDKYYAIFSFELACRSDYLKRFLFEHSCLSNYLKRLLFEHACRSDYLKRFLFEHACRSDYLKRFLFEHACRSDYLKRFLFEHATPWFCLLRSFRCSTILF